MGGAGIGSALASAGSQYDFTKMTNQQFFNAVNTLGSEGKISQNDTANLSAIAQGIDSVPISGPSPTAQQFLADPTQHNFILEVQGDDYGAHLGGSIVPGGASLYDDLLKDLETYQTSSTSANGSRLSITA
jgi:hypothetical protein